MGVVLCLICFDFIPIDYMFYMYIGDVGFVAWLVNGCRIV